VGRVNFSHPEAPLFTYPGVQVVAGFEGTSIKMMAKPQSGFYMAQIDDGTPFKVDYLTKTDSTLVLAEGLAEGRHEVRLMYAVEGYELRPEFYGFVLDPGKDLTEAPALPQRKIEFIGNSITCGYGIEADVATNHFSYETENHYYTYAALTARALHAQHVTVARSGIGIFRNYNGPFDGTPEVAMPALYDYTNFNDSTEVWDYNRYQPDVVCMNLGTNDTSTGRYNKTKLREAYAGFLQHLRSRYPAAKIVLLSGCMLSGQRMKDVEDALDRVMEDAHKRGDHQVYRFVFPAQDGSLGFGADYHPSKRQQEKMASELTPFLQELMGW
ncbi:MAG: lipase, partial [Bacteroidaceae bacterium]|nr:lipase [Bacteroidaceae bacterium]